LIDFIKDPKFVIHFLMLALLSCCISATDRPQSDEAKDISEPLIIVNKELVKTEDQRIEDFIARYNWKMDITGTGLRYAIYRQGCGIPAQKGFTARYHYTLTLLTGDTIYTSEESGPKEIIVGKGGVENGLEEGILLLKKGDRAKLIIPSHLAFGLVGDMDKIPAKATLVYDIELIDLIKN
jgi:FKBP-type peptidyl-prolyl cis-trans isomerase FkpA